MDHIQKNPHIRLKKALDDIENDLTYSIDFEEDNNEDQNHWIKKQQTKLTEFNVKIKIEDLRTIYQYLKASGAGVFGERFYKFLYNNGALKGRKRYMKDMNRFIKKITLQEMQDVCKIAKKDLKKNDPRADSQKITLEMANEKFLFDLYSIKQHLEKYY